MENLFNRPLIRKAIDSLPEHNPWIKKLRVGAKALLFRRRIIPEKRILFAGVEDAIYERILIIGPGRDEVAVTSSYTAVSPGTEKGYYLDLPNFFQKRPYVPGYSGCGWIRSRGKAVSSFKKGDLVAGILKHSNVNILAAGEVVPVPEGLNPLYAAFVTLGVIALTGLRSASIEKGDKVAIMGQGILGQLLNQLVRLTEVQSICAVARSQSKKEMALKSGVDEFISSSDQSLALKSVQANVVIDSTGNLEGFEDALKIVIPGGRVVMLGSIPEYARDSNWAKTVVDKCIEVRGAHVRNLEEEGLSYRSEAARFLNLLAEKKIKMDHLISDIYKPEDAPGIYRRFGADSRDMVGVAIEWRKRD